MGVEEVGEAVNPPALVPARMVNELLYCERLMALEWVQREFADNAFTLEGRYVHSRADEPRGKLAAPGAAEAPYQARSVWLSSAELGLTAKIDVVEGDKSGTVVPIEYKRGKPPDVPEGAYLWNGARAVHGDGTTAGEARLSSRRGATPTARAGCAASSRSTRSNTGTHGDVPPSAAIFVLWRRMFWIMSDAARWLRAHEAIVVPATGCFVTVGARHHPVGALT